jgi:hypothetical protein
MRVWRWFFRRPVPVALCGHCRSELLDCGECHGDWRATGCRCGIGTLCPECGRHWA